MSKDGDFNDFNDQCRGWRVHLVRTYPTFDDIDSVIAVAMWEHYSSGVRDEREMFKRVRVAVRRHVRVEARQSDIRSALRHDHSVVRASAREDAIGDAVDAIATTQRLAALNVPELAQPWINHVKAEVRTPIPASQRMAGLRWAQTARKVLADA